MRRVLFYEEQHFTHWWLLAVLIMSLLSFFVPFAYGIYSQEVLSEPLGNNPMSTEGLIATGVVSLLIVGVIFVLFVNAKLKTKITNEYIMVAFSPFFRKWRKFTPTEIKEFKVHTNNALRGYGIKQLLKYGLWHKDGQSFTISGKTGLQLNLKTGKKILIGTQKKQAIQYAMEKFISEGNSTKNG
jgi:branched-subunit amino acid ABC-type transport system permease component